MFYNGLFVLTQLVRTFYINLISLSIYLKKLSQSVTDII